MKKILILVLVMSFFSCGDQKGKTENTSGNESELSILNKYGVPDSLLKEGSYLVILDEERFVPILNQWNQNFDEDSTGFLKIKYELTNKILDFAETNKLQIDPTRIFLNSITGFLIEKETPKKMLSLLGVNGVKKVQQNFFMQNTRARMQSGNPLLQNTRARMQEHPEWGYDITNYTSKAVTYLGGNGIPVPKNRKIWIVDSGIDADHRDFTDKQVDEDLSRSFVFYNYNVNDLNPFYDFWGHGTHCAGLAAAKAKNIGNPDHRLIGMTGIAPGAPLVSIKVFGMHEYSEIAWIMEALDYISGTRKSIEGDVISMSFAGRDFGCQFEELKTILLNIVNIRGAFVVTAAGNDFGSGVSSAQNFIPACINANNFFTIGSMDLNYQNGSIRFSSFSNFENPPIDWVVPGNYIFSTYPNNKYAVMQGTSMSTALMAGLLYLTNGTLNTQAQVPGINGESYTYPVPKK